MDAPSTDSAGVAAGYAVLEHVPIFGALSTPTLAFLLQRAETIAVARGDYFFREGECGNGVYILQRGVVEVQKERNGVFVALRQLSAGACFGEIAVLAMIPRTASVRAVEDCAAICLRTSNIHELFDHDLEQFTLLIMNLGREVCRRLKRTDDALFRLSPDALIDVRQQIECDPE